MKGDKFLIGIVIGIVLLVVIALGVVLIRGQGSDEYVADDTPAGVAQNYFLAIQQRDFEKAYGYLADTLPSKPDLDEFIREMDDSARGSEATLQIGETRMGDVHTQVDVSLTTYRVGGIFETNSYTMHDTVFLQAIGDGSVWKITEFPYPYWGYYWNDEQ
jgi:hypothetical protein